MRTPAEYYDEQYGNIRQKFQVKEPVLDVGGGKGYFLQWLGIKEAIIIDKNPETLAGYKKMVADMNNPFEIDGRTFKTVFCMECLEHLRFPLVAFKMLYCFLDYDGICYISVPHTPLNDMHLNHWTLNELTRMAHEVGFTKIKLLVARNTIKRRLIGRPHCFIVMELRK